MNDKMVHAVQVAKITVQYIVIECNVMQYIAYRGGRES